MTIPSTGQVSASQVNIELNRSGEAPFSMVGAWEKRLTKKNLHPYSFADFRGKAFLRVPYSGGNYSIADNNRHYFEHVGSSGNANLYWGGGTPLWSGYVGQIINENVQITVGYWVYTPGAYRDAVNNNTHRFEIFRWRVTG